MFCGVLLYFSSVFSFQSCCRVVSSRLVSEASVWVEIVSGKKKQRMFCRQNVHHFDLVQFGNDAPVSQSILTTAQLVECTARREHIR